MTNLTSVYEGTTIRVYTSQPFETVDGTPTDPTTVVFGLQIANGATQQVTYGNPTTLGRIVKDGVGSYHIDLDTTDQPGIWSWVFVGQGSVQAIGSGQINVIEPPVTVTLS